MHDMLERDINSYKQKGNILVCGDLNSRVGNFTGLYPKR